jgi:hypothetical protein
LRMHLKASMSSASSNGHRSDDHSGAAVAV